MCALRQGQQTCVMCDDECFATSNPYPEHVGRSEPFVNLIIFDGTGVRVPLSTVVQHFCHDNVGEPDSVFAVSVGSELVEDESANGSGSAASEY